MIPEVLSHALRHFYHADKANAAIHCAPVRFSPITFRLAEALDSAYDIDDPYIREVLSHKGQYQEDTGR
jgi:hypothetical protein